MAFDRIALARFNSVQARVVAGWAYPPPYNIYSSADTLYDELLADHGDGLGYFVLTGADSDVPFGFCCYGSEARVVNQPEPEPNTLDVGGGIAPDLVSKGLGTKHLPAVVQHSIGLHRPTWLRVAVAAFNERSLSMCRSNGFVDGASFEGPGGRTFTELYRAAIA